MDKHTLQIYIVYDFNYEWTDNAIRAFSSEAAAWDFIHKPENKSFTWAVQPVLLETE